MLSIFSLNIRRWSAPASSTTAALATLGAALVLAACGGGTSQVEPFAPQRVVALGDELSAFASGGRKYGVNALDSAGTGINCEGHPLWIQAVADVYGFKYSACQGTATDAFARTLAVPGAGAEALVSQVDTLAAEGFTGKVLITVLSGMHDVKTIYEGRGTLTDEELMTQARARGVIVAQQVNRLVELGGKVVVVTVPDIGLSPYGLAQGATNAALLSNLTAALNGRIRVNILNDGRFVGLVLADEMVQTASRFPTVYGLANVANAACSSAVPDCSTSTLVSGASAETWLWADDLRIGVLAQRQLGTLAAARAVNNPF